MTQSIEVVIPVHDPRRPVNRGVRSVLDQRSDLAALGVELAVTVVCHNISAAELSGGMDASIAADAAVRWLEHADGVRSPSGPRNAALENSSATFISFLDSDDYLEPGSLSAWLLVAQDVQAAAVIAPLRTPEDEILRSPRLRPSKPNVLDAVLDGLAYRSVPYGLLRRESLLACGFRYAEGITIGEDLEATLRLWFRGGRIAYPYEAPAYQQTDDAGPDRVTSTLRPLADEFRWLDLLIRAQWLCEASTLERRSIALKLMRVHGIGALRRRGTWAGRDQPVWSADERSDWAVIRRQLLDLADGSLPALSRRDAALSRQAAAANDENALRDAVARHSRAGRLGDLVTSKPLAMLSADSVLRHYINERRRTKSEAFGIR